MNRTPNDAHPEQAREEEFFTNASAAEFAAMEWKTKRRGRVAYDGRGRIVRDQRDWFPVFIAKDELRREGGDIREARRRWRAARPPVGA